VFDEDKQECVQPTKREDFECLLGSKFPSAYVEEDDEDDDNSNDNDSNQSKDNGIITKPLSKIFITPLLKKITQTTQAFVSNSTRSSEFSQKTTLAESFTTVSSSTVKQTNKKRYSSLRAKDKQITTNKKKQQDEINETNDEENENLNEDQTEETSSTKKSKEKDTEYNDDSDSGKKSTSDDTDYEYASTSDENSNQADYKRMCVVTNW
jgi:hypothetical protein